MKFMALIALLVSLNAHATGEFTCTGVDAEGNNISVTGGASHTPGNMLITDVLLVREPLEIAQVFKKDNLVGYWNSKKKFKIAIVDDNAENIILKITAKRDDEIEPFKGKLTLNDEEKIKVNCVTD